jgi:hypothetical protein
MAQAFPCEVRVGILDRELPLYRACFATSDTASVDSFRSHYELQWPPRGVEKWATVIYMAVSMFETRAPCWDLIERTQGRIGDRVGELRLGPGRGSAWQRQAGPLHWSVWGRPDALQAAVHTYLRR